MKVSLPSGHYYKACLDGPDSGCVLVALKAREPVSISLLSKTGKKLAGCPRLLEGRLCATVTPGASFFVLIENESDSETVVTFKVTEFGS